jgi:hypothetical protein
VTHAPRLLGCLLPLVATAAAAAQSFDYPNFASTAGLSLNGSAAVVTNTMRVTNNVADTVGSFWRTTPVRVGQGFETRFDFSITNGCEGLAFVVHAAPTGATTLGGNLWGMGYGYGGNTSPIGNSLVVEIDAIQDFFLNDTSANEVSVHSAGQVGNSENENVSIGRASPTTDLSNNNVHSLRIRYVPGVIEVFVGTATTPAISAPWTFQSGGTQLSGGNTGGLQLMGDDAWVGFTSSTPAGSASQNATVRSWNWISYQLPEACYVGNAGSGAGGPYDLLTINGSNGGFFRIANLLVANPFTLAVATPPSVASAPYLLFAWPGLASGTATITPYGNACFPLVAMIDIGAFVAPHSLAVPPGIPLDIPLTFQAVMATNPANPSIIELTNAIGVQFALAPAPAISGVTPNSVAAGNPVTVNGSNFSPFATVDINGVFVTPTTLTATQVVFPMPAGVSCGSTLRVRNPDGAFATANFNPTPTITNQINVTGPSAGGTTYIVIGTGFAVGTTATIGGVPATVATASATVVTIVTPPGTPGPKPVVLTTPGGCIANGTFTYL